MSLDGNRDHLIQFMAEQFKATPCVFVEVGVWTGTFSARVLREVNVREAHLVDPWIYTKELVRSSLPLNPYCLSVPFSRVRSQEHMDAIHAAVVDKFSSDGRVHVHRKASAEAVICFPDNSFDWVYIDGDHSFEAVRHDICSWSSKVKRGGFLSGDDYDWGEHLGRPVKKAVDAFLASAGNMRLLSKDNGQWLMQKT